MALSEECHMSKIISCDLNIMTRLAAFSDSQRGMVT